MNKNMIYYASVEGKKSAARLPSKYRQPKKGDKDMNNITPKRGSVAEIKRQTAFEERTISLGKAILEGIGAFAIFAVIIFACAV